MKKYKVFVFLILLMLAAPVVLIAGGNSEKADEEKIIAVLDDYGKFLIAGDYESWGLLHSENVVKMPPDVFPTTTRQDMVLQSSKSGEFTGYCFIRCRYERNKYSKRLCLYLGNVQLGISPKRWRPISIS